MSQYLRLRHVMYSRGVWGVEIIYNKTYLTFLLKVKVEFWLANSCLQTLKVECWLANSHLPTLKVEFWLANSHLLTLKVEFWLANSHLLTLKAQFWLANSHLLTLKIECWLANSCLLTLKVECWLDNSHLLTINRRPFVYIQPFICKTITSDCFNKNGRQLFPLSCTSPINRCSCPSCLTFVRQIMYNTVVPLLHGHQMPPLLSGQISDALRYCKILLNCPPQERLPLL